MESTDGVGAYGLRWVGLADTAGYLQEAAADWTSVGICHQPDVVPLTEEVVRDDFARYWVSTFGHVRLERRPLVATIRSPLPPTAASLAHPFLSLTAAVVNRWLDRDAFHAGGFIVGDGAWGVLGTKEAGKSSLLGYLAREGYGIVADDMLVVDGRGVLAGPRCIDLRPSAALHLGVGENLGVIGTRERWRMRTPHVTSSTPLRGWVVPSWAPEVAVEPLPAAERVTSLLGNLALNVPPREALRIFRLASLPFVSFRRPKDWRTMPASTARLVQALEENPRRVA